MAYTTPKTYSASEVLNAAADLNTYESGNTIYLHDVPAAGATRLAPTSISVSTVTAIDLDTAETFDTDSLHSLVTNPSRITFNETAVWLVTAQGVWESITASGHYQLIVYLNGTTAIAQYSTGEKITTSPHAQTCTAIREFTSGDYVELAVFQSGGTENLSSARMSVVRLRDG